MKIAICDDEQSCIDRLRALLAAYCTGRRLACDCQTFTNPLIFCQGELTGYDVVFLDANMGEVDGIAAAQALRKVNPSAILCYVSGFVEYAPMGYRVDAFRYLMKCDLDSHFAECMDEIVKRLERNRRQLSVSTTEGERILTVSSLVYIESFHHQIFLHLKDGGLLESRQHSLAELSALLLPHSFLRIHKSYLVNPEHIASIKNRVVLLEDGQTLSCGKKDYSETLRAFTLWKGGM